MRATRQRFLAIVMLSCLVWVATSARAGPPHELIERLHQTIEADAERLKEIFKDLHQNPELGFQEVRTAGILAKELEALGYEVKTGIGVTGVVGILRNGEGPTVMYRADMDANAVREETGLPYASTATTRRTGTDGKEEEVPVAHLCGHDAHVTWMIGLAKAFAQHKAHWSGTLVLVGQPAEEPVAGAKAMVHDGMYTRHGVPIPDFLIGLHTAAIRTGLVACAAGDINAGTDQLDVTFFGVGGHGSSPHLTKDPVLMACTAVIQYQFIVSRAIDPANSAVVTVGSVQAGSDNNVIPASSLLKINLRWYDPEDRKLMLESIERINRSIASAYNLPEALYPKTVMKGGSVVLSNNRELALKVAPVLKSFLGEKSVMLSVPRVMGSEDFHHLVVETGKNIPYLYLYVGTAKPEHFDRARAEGKLVPYANHNPDYQVDIDAIPLGAKIGAASVARLFQPAE